MDNILTLKSGLRILIVPMPYLRSMAMGIAVGAGTITEKDTEGGLSHFIEHMLFKGTQKRTAFDIADEAECNGIQLNAYTTKRMTVFYALSTSGNIDKSADMLSDMFFNSTFEKDCLKKEKSVVIEEISMYEDDADDVCHEALNKAHYGGSILERPILGTRESVNSFTKENIQAYMNRVYTPDNTVICIAGGITDQQGIDIVEKYFESKFTEYRKFEKTTLPEISPKCQSISIQKNKFEQANVGISFRSFPYGKKTEEMSALIEILSGGMSSRLFQKVREEKGLVYSIYGDNTTFQNNGMFHLHFATNPKCVKEAVLTIRETILDFVRDGITEKELSKCKELAKSELAIGTETSSAIMKIMTRNMILAGEKFDMDEKLKKIQAVTVDDVNAAIKYVFDFDTISTAYVGVKTDVDVLRLMKEGK